MATPSSIEPAAPPPPSSATPAAKPLSSAELSAELTPKTPPAPQMRPPTIPEPKEQKPSPDRPDFKAALKERVMGKAEPAPEAKPKPAEQKAPEAKKTVVSADDAPPPPKPSDAPAEVPEDQRRVLPHDKPDTAKRIKAILAERDAAKAEAAAAKAEYEAAKKAPASTPEELAKLKADYDAAQSDLMRYRRLHDIESDKEFTARYREPVKQTEKSIEETLKKNGMTDPVLEVIRKHGGFASFSRSTQTFTVNEPDGEGGTKPVQRTAAELARGWLGSLPVADSEFVRTAVGKQQLLQDEEKNALATAQAEAKAYFDNQTAAQRAQAEAASQAQQKTLKEYQDWLKETEEKTDWLKERSVPDNATAEQKAEIQRYNEFNAQLRARVRKDPTNAKEYGELKLEAAESHHLRRTLGEKDAEIAALKEQLSKAKGAMRTTPKGGSLLKSDAPPSDKPKGDPNDPTNYRIGLRARVLGGRDEE